jgi:hypothetical protein
MIGLIIEYLKRKHRESQERQIRIDERRNSVDCPYCKTHHTRSEIVERQQPSGLGDDNITIMKCRTCEETFSIKYTYTPCVECSPGISFRTSYKLPFKLKD